jgi:hypothetical protein
MCNRRYIYINERIKSMNNYMYIRTRNSILTYDFRPTREIELQGINFMSMADVTKCPCECRISKPQSFRAQESDKIVQVN